MWYQNIRSASFSFVAIHGSDRWTDRIATMKRISPNFGDRCMLVSRCDDYVLGSKGQTSRSQQAEALNNNI